jgi:3-hydroxyisobutyrate dehydrogenase
MKIAFFGTGLMGTGFVHHLIENGHDVVVWNRTHARAQEAIGFGATLADSPAHAVAGAHSVHLSLSDDASVDAVLEPLATAIAPETWIVDHTTTAPTPTKARAEAWTARGHKFIHAPVFMAPANCHAGTGLMLLSGPAAYHEALKPLLSSMTGNLVYLGEATDRAAAFKLFGNMTLLGMMGVLADVNRLAHACGIATADAFGLFQQFNPGVMLPVRAAKIANAEFSPASFEMTMARKDLRLMIEEAARAGVTLGVTPAVAALLDAGIARGDGALDASAAARVK